MSFHLSKDKESVILLHPTAVTVQHLLHCVVCLPVSSRTIVASHNSFTHQNAYFPYRRLPIVPA